MASKVFVENLVKIHKGWFEGDVARFPSVYNKEQFEKALALHEQRKACEHDWQKTDNWLIDRCSKCGEERA